MNTTSFLRSLFPVGCFTALVAGSGLVLAAVVAEKNQVKLEVGGGFRRIVSNGWPDHAPGVFPRRGNPNTISAQHYEFRVPMVPELGGELRRADGFWWGVAVNGVPFEPGTAETWKNERPSAWRYEAGTGFLDLGLDEHHAHVQPTGAYHYHGRPVGLLEGLGGDGSEMRLVGWAADGFPLYSAMAAEGEAGADGKPGKLRKMISSYRLKAGKRPAAPEGPGGKYDGRFTEDWEFVRGSGDLDECNGRTGWTPEFPKGTYYYCVTEDFPFLPRFWRGKPDASFSKGGPPPARGGGAPGGGPPGEVPPGGGPEGRRPPPPLVSVLDLDHSGELEADEISKAPESLKKLDRNGDGRLDFEEMRPPGMERPGPGSGPGPEAGPGPGPGQGQGQERGAAPGRGPGAARGRGPVEPPIDP